MSEGNVIPKFSDDLKEMLLIFLLSERTFMILFISWVKIIFRLILNLKIRCFIKKPPLHVPWQILHSGKDLLHAQHSLFLILLP